MVKIITDSAADMEPWEYEKWNVACIPIAVRIGEREYLENVDLSKDLFYDLVAQGGFPQTSQPAPKYLLDLLEDAKRSGDEAVYICISSGISGTYQTALATRELVDYENCHVVDSLNATGGQRLLVEHAVRLRDQGKTARQIVAELESLRQRIVLYACMDTLEYLYRGGRISQTVYKLGTMAQVKPVIRVSPEGRIEVPAKAMGMRKGMEYLTKRLETRQPDPEHPFYVMYTGQRENGNLLAQRFRDMGYDIPDQRIINVGAAIGSHVGPNACGFVFVGRN